MKEEKIVSKPLDIPFKEFMPGQVIQSVQFNDDMRDIEDKVNEVISKHNSNVEDLHSHLDDKANPHEVNPHQIGTYESEEIDIFIDDVKSGNLYDNSIGNRVLDDGSVDNRVLQDGSVTVSKVDSEFGSQVDISGNISIIDRYTKNETDELIYEKVGEGTYSKEEIDSKFEDYQAGTIIDGTIDASKLKDDVGSKIDISNNVSIVNRYTKSEVDTLIQKNGLPKDWGGLGEIGDDDTTPTELGHLPITDVMMCGEFKSSETDTLNIKTKEVVDARTDADGTHYPSIGDRLDNFDSQLETKAKQIDLEVERARIDSFTKLTSGSTTGDAELIDGRIGADGVTYGNIGANVRNFSSKIIDVVGGDLVSAKLAGYNKKPLLETAFSATNATQTILTGNGRNLVWNKSGTYIGVTDSTVINDSITLATTDRILFVSKIKVNQNDFNSLDFRLNLSGLGTESIYKTVFNTVNGNEYYIAGIVPINSAYTTATARGVAVTIASLSDNTKTLNIDVNSIYCFIIKDSALVVDVNNPQKLYSNISSNVITIINHTDGKLDIMQSDINDLKNNVGEISKWKGKNVLVLGDSISADYYLGYKSWATQLSEQKEFNLINNSVHANGFICKPNSATSGDDSMINKIDTVYSQYPSSTAFDLIIMFMGTNDFGNEVPLGKYGDGNKDKSLITTFHGGVEYCTRKALEYWCGARIVVFTPMQRRTQIYATSEGKNLKDYRDVIVEKANYMGFPVLDLYTQSGFYPVKYAFNSLITTDGTEATNNAFCNMYCMKPDSINPDGLHPNELFTSSRLVPFIGEFLERL